MNTTDLYKLLNFAEAFYSAPATLTKRDGTIVNVRITPEDRTTLAPSSPYPAAFTDAVFSIDAADFTEVGGEATYPAEGDVATTIVDGVELRYKVVKDPETGRSWTWRFDRPGTRLTIKTLKLG